VLIRVSDTGCGVPKEHLESIFEQLHQIPDVAYRTRRGLGLGLFITRELVRGMNGEIRVNSEPGKGAAFEVFLPMLSWPALLEPLESLGRESGHELLVLRVSVGWSDGDLSEPIPDSPIWNLSDLLPRVLSSHRHILLPRTQVGARVHLGAVLLAERGAWPAMKSELRSQLLAGAASNEPAVVTAVDDLLLARWDGGLRESDITSRLERFYLQPSQGDESCTIVSRTVIAPA
jgi:hypothetical protein